MEHALKTSIELPIQQLSTFDLDDAFSDGEPYELTYQFSPEAIREDIARNMPITTNIQLEVESDTAQNGTFKAQNTSVSTIDINGNGVRSRSTPPGSPTSPTDSSNFSQISLSVSASSSDKESAEASRFALTEDDRTASYPNIVIDASAGTPTSHRITSTSEQTKLSEISLESASPPSFPPLEFPHTIESTQSLPTHSVRPALPQIQSNTATPTPTTSPSPSTAAFAPGPIPSSSSAPHAELQSPQKPFTHRPTRSIGPSTFEKVRSKTRPMFLPPKPRQEDEKHMADWQSMMKLSRAAAEKRRKALNERRLAREKHIEDSIHIWEKEIVPDWKVVNRNPSLRKLWWRGIPTKLRASMWERAVGNGLALSKDHYRICLARAKRALLSGVFPQTSMSLIEEDMSTTLPALHIFHPETGPLYPELKDMLCAWVVSRSDEGLGYALGAAKIAAMLLINMPVQQGFVVMRNLMERHCMRSFFGGEGAKDDVEAYYRIFDTLLADGMPKIYFNFKQHQISPAAYLNDWLLPLFLDHLPFEACARVWDVLLLEGDSFLYRASLGILAVLEPRLFFPDRRELLELLRGENKAALDVAKREGRNLDGGKYEIYSVDEETLWERIDHMDEWWKESTWTRLLQRELPDL
ncbi:rab-GTPase-TBC domain-containing protein [Collybia nuda]|uniref:Rab-GTPase-TBC domain-containing protein n=1 Tax=Collybia nuda TaxID=64659 RepID=A0A9P6CKD4_9AGAR|nr:rab-GTPase-TBC domain-containing protein [Collybia nuda]